MKGAQPGKSCCELTQRSSFHNASKQDVAAAGEEDSIWLCCFLPVSSLPQPAPSLNGARGAGLARHLLTACSFAFKCKSAAGASDSVHRPTLTFPELQPLVLSGIPVLYRDTLPRVGLSRKACVFVAMGDVSGEAPRVT